VLHSPTYLPWKNLALPCSALWQWAVWHRRRHCSSTVGRSRFWAPLLGEQLLQGAARVCASLPFTRSPARLWPVAGVWVGVSLQTLQRLTAPLQCQPGSQALGTCSTFVVACSVPRRQLLKTPEPVCLSLVMVCEWW
jgi:hypothetical protein